MSRHNTRKNKVNLSTPVIVAIVSMIGALLTAVITTLPQIIKTYNENRQLHATETAAASLSLANTPAPPAAPLTANTPTDSPVPLARITNLLEGDSVSHLMTIMGEYRPDLADPL